MRHREPSLRLYWGVVILYGALFGWLLYVFMRHGDLLVERVHELGAPLDAAQAHAVRAASHETMRMILIGGGLLGVVLLAGLWVVLRSLQGEARLRKEQHDFLSAVTHELRSPIASAKLYTESLLLGRVKAEKHDRYLERVKEDLERLDQMVEMVLQSASAANKALEVHPEPLDLAAFVQELRGELVSENALRGAAVEILAPRRVQVLADHTALETILRNLVSNAIKYGGEKPRVNVTVSQDGAWGVLEVRDFGPGLQEADRRRIFHAFVRGGDEDVRTRPGVGLGLFMVAELTRALGGKVKALDGLPGGGTLLRVALPVTEA